MLNTCQPSSFQPKSSTQVPPFLLVIFLTKVLFHYTLLTFANHLPLHSVQPESCLYYDQGESLPQWEQGQDQECKDDQPNAGGI